MTETVFAHRPITALSSRAWRRIACAAVCLIAAMATSGCLDLEQSIVVNRDLTGKAGFKMSMNLEPFMNQMVQMIGSAGGSAPPPEAIEQMKQGMASQFGAGMVDVEALKKSLPAGVTLIDSTQKLDGMTMAMSFNFAYTDIRKLPEIAMMPRAGVGGTDPKPMKPFEDLEFKDDGATLVIATKAPAPPATGAEAQANAGVVANLMQELNQPGMQEMLAGMADAMKGLRVAIRIETPLTVVETNAPARVGAAMVWEQKLDKLPTTPGAAMPDMKPMTVMVKIKK